MMADLHMAVATASATLALVQNKPNVMREHILKSPPGTRSHKTKCYEVILDVPKNNLSTSDGNTFGKYHTWLWIIII